MRAMEEHAVESLIRSAVTLHRVLDGPRASNPGERVRMPSQHHVCPCGARKPQKRERRGGWGCSRCSRAWPMVTVVESRGRGHRQAAPMESVLHRATDLVVCIEARTPVGHVPPLSLWERRLTVAHARWNGPGRRTRSLARWATETWPRSVHAPFSERFVGEAVQRGSEKLAARFRAKGLL